MEKALKFIKELPSSEGYAIDGRAPRWDFSAVVACNKIFGKHNVTQVLRKYKRAHVTKEALYNDVMEYDVARAPRLEGDKTYIAAFQSVRKEFVPQIPIIPLTMGGAIKSPTNPKDKSPGLPWKQLGYKTKQDVYDDLDAMKAIRKEWILIGKGYRVNLPDCLVFARAQLSSRDGPDKVRATWGYPTSVFVEESRYVYPYLDFLKKRRDDYPLAYGIEIGLGGMGYINEMFDRCHRPTGVMLDWSRFDKHVPAWLIRDAFTILYECFNHSYVRDSEGMIWEVNPEITQRRWKKMVNYFINTPFRMPDGRRFQKIAGVPSGSGWTNIIDSIVNAIVTRYCTFHVTGSLPPYDMYMGDDSVIVTDKAFNLDSFAKLASSRFGFVLSEHKSFVTKNSVNLQFLGYTNNDGYPIRDQDFLMASFMLPERLHEPDPLLTTARAIGQMWSTFNGKAAQKWYAIVDLLQSEFQLDYGWFTGYMKENPNKLKFLRLHGLEATTFPEPHPFDEFNAPMAPPRAPGKRRPIRRITDIEDLYYQFIDDPPPELDVDIIEIDEPPIDVVDDFNA